MRNIFRVFKPSNKVGLVLGGGGARGIAHIGILKVLVENKIPIYCIAGTSSGALFGALFSGGMNPYDMAKEARTMDWLKLMKFSLSTNGPVTGEGIEEIITKNIGKKNIEDLRIPLSIVATDLRSGEKKIITKGNIGKAVRASSAIPGVFSPVLIDGRLLADGMMVDNVPVFEAKNMGANFVIAVDVVPLVTLDGWQPNPLNVIERAIDISNRARSFECRNEADVILNPVTKNISARSLERADELIEMGEAAAQKALPEIRSKLGV